MRTLVPCWLHAGKYWAGHALLMKRHKCTCLQQLNLCTADVVLSCLNVSSSISMFVSSAWATPGHIVLLMGEILLTCKAGTLFPHKGQDKLASQDVTQVSVVSKPYNAKIDPAYCHVQSSMQLLPSSTYTIKQVLKHCWQHFPRKFWSPWRNKIQSPDTPKQHTHEFEPK